MACALRAVATVRAARAPRHRTPARESRAPRTAGEARAKEDEKPEGTEGAFDGLEVDGVSEELMAKLLAREDVQKQLEAVEAAADKVEAARAAAKALEVEMLLEDERIQQARVESEAQSAVADAAADVLSAAAAVRRSEEELAELRRQAAAAEGSPLGLLGLGAGGVADDKWVTEGVDEDEQRLESAKAGALGGAAGGLIALPAYALGGGSVLAGVCGSAVSAALFAITYRYALRRDVGNGMLRMGVVAAFAVSRAAGAVSVAQAQGLGLSSALEPSLEGVVVLLAAQFALDRALSLGFVRAFPS